MGKDGGTGAKRPSDEDAIAWALVEHELDASNPTEQRTRAILQLFRWLAIGKTIAVVGSGASMVYGYPDWGDLVDKIRDLFLSRNYDKKTDSESISNYEILFASLDEDKNPRKKPAEKTAKEPRAPHEHDPRLSRDEKLALCDALANCLSAEGLKRYHDDVARIFDRSEHCHRRSALLANHPIGAKIEDLLESLPLRDLTNPAPTEDLLPADIAGLLITLPIKMKRPAKLRKQRPKALINAPRNLLDPLSELRSRIGIHRFVTFNYDLEVETLLEDLDYPYRELTRIPGPDDPPSLKPELFSESRLGGTAHSISLSPENASDLITVAAVPSSANDLVVHVHGAVTRASDMVVTQSAYNAMYYEEKPFRRSFEDARRLLFGGNAVLHVGFGLSEEDVMRPLRYLSADLRNRPLFALVPLLSNETRARAFELKIKANYGVSVITYGRSFGNIPDAWKRQDTLHPLQSKPEDDFISLGDELREIRKAFLLPEGHKPSLDHFKSGLIRLVNEKGSFPRLHHGNSIAPKLAKLILDGFIQSNLKPDHGKTEKFVKTLYSMAITTALNNAIEYMQIVTREWQRQLRLWPPNQIYKSNFGLHYGAVHRVPLIPGTSGLDDASDTRQIGDLMPPDRIATGVRIVRIDPGKGRGTYFNLVKKRAEKRKGWRVVSLSYTMRGTTVLSDILARLDDTRLLFLQDADCLLDATRSQPETLFLEAFLQELKARCERVESGRGLHLILTVRSERSANTYLRIFAHSAEKKDHAHRLTVHSAEHLKKIGGERWKAFALLYPHLADAMAESRWAFLAVNGAYQNLYDVRGKKEFLPNCNRALHNRLFSIASKHNQAALCEVLLEERHRLIQRSMDIRKRNQIIVENIIIKWMYAIPIPIDLATIGRIPEIDELKKDTQKSYPPGGSKINPDEGNGHRVDESTIRDALVALKQYRFIFEIDYREGIKQDSDESRYILHSAMRQLLGYRRGFSLDAPPARDNNSVGLSLILMDGGPMLSVDDFKSSCELFDNLIKGRPGDENRIAMRSAYALIRSTIHTQGAMRAGLISEPADYSRSALHAHLRRLSRFRSLSRKNHELAKGRPILYAEDELWLLNELGIIRFLQGNMHDAVFSFRESMAASERIMIGKRSMAEIDPSLKPRISINLALCLIERARFHDAESLVDNALENFKTEPKHEDTPEYLLLWALLHGCRAQIHLLTAQLDSARSTVEQALPVIERLGALGAQAWLHSVQASAELASDDHDRADAAISLALAAARGAHRPDLILSLELSSIDIQLIRSRYNRETVFGSLNRLENLERSALRLGSHKSRCSAMLIRARALLTIEQVEPAREAIIEAISIAQLNGMRLKRISGLILLVALMAQRGEREPAKKLLRSVKLAANRARYVRAVADIERLQQAMEIEGGVPQWAGFVSDFGSTDRRRSALR